jgi:hypothetical protein
LHQLAALDKHLAHFRIHHQIDVTLPVAQLYIGQPMPLLREWQQILGEKRDLFHVHRQFPGTGTKQVSADSNVVAQIEQFVQLESLFSDCILLDVDLQPLPILLQVREPSLPHQPDGHDAPRDAHVDPRILQLLASLLRVLRQNLRNRVSEFVFAGIDLLSQSFNLFQLLAPQFVNFLVECQWVPCSNDYKRMNAPVPQTVNSDYKQDRGAHRV